MSGKKALSQVGVFAPFFFAGEDERCALREENDLGHRSVELGSRAVSGVI